MRDLEAYATTVQMLALCRYGRVNGRSFEALMRHFGSLERILRSDSGTLMAIQGMDVDRANRISKASDSLDKAAQFYQSLRDRQIEPVTHFDDAYPRRLEEVNDPPPILFWRGRVLPNNVKSVTICGAGESTQAGMELSSEVTREFALRGVEIVSSLRVGCDAAVHLSAKKAGAGSIAVLESGFDHLHPIDHAALAVDIALTGGLVSEFEPDTRWRASNFRSSNRLLAGITNAVIITECYEKSHETIDLMVACGELGKLIFVNVDPRLGALVDEFSLEKAQSNGAIVMVGMDKINDIVQSLV
jgi:DNA processing protein